MYFTRRLTMGLVAVVAASSFFLSNCTSNNQTPITRLQQQAMQAVLGTPVTNGGVTIFNQTVPIHDSDNSIVFPGQANYWDLSSDFSTGDGGDDQWDHAMMLNLNGTVDSGGDVSGGTYFPGSNFVNGPANGQTYSELTFLTPLFGPAEGIIPAAVFGNAYDSPLDGTYSAALNCTATASLSQTLDLTGATTPITLTWTDKYNGDDANISGQPANYRVVITDDSGHVLMTAFQTPTSTATTTHTVDLSSLAGQRVTLTFESQFTSSYGEPSAIIDDVSVQDADTHEYVVNGDFETGDLTGWTANDPEPQNVMSGARTVEGLSIQRSFYTQPNQLWARYADSFTNEGASTVNAEVIYQSNLGSDSFGIVYDVAGTNNQAVASWDGAGSDRDVGLVFPGADNIAFTSATALHTSNGGDNGHLDNITATYNITVDPGQTVTLVSFVIMDGTDTYDTATDASAKATEIDAQAQAILANLTTDPSYANGLTQNQLQTVVNVNGHL